MKQKENRRKITLVIESESKSNNLWGRIEFDNDLIIDTAQTINELQIQMQELIKERYHLEAEQLEVEIICV